MIRRLATPALLVAAGALLLSFLWVEIYDIDVWWQLAIGRDIVATGVIPSADRWSLLGAGRAYHDSHWLFQVVLWLAYSAGGWAGVQGMVLVFWGAALMALLKIASRRLAPAPAALVVTLAALACAERFLPRPELATYAAFAWVLFLLPAEGRQGPSRLALVAIIQALWTNAHGLFVLGPFVALAQFVAALLDPVRRATALRRGLPALTVSCAATLANPAGLRAWTYAFRLAREAGEESTGLIGSLGEMASPFAEVSRRVPAMWVFYVLLAAGALSVLHALLRRTAGANVAVALACAGLACTGRRNVVLYALSAVPLISDWMATLRWPAAAGHPTARWLTAVGLGGLCVLPLSGRYYLWMEIPARFGRGITPSYFPHGIASRLARGEFGAGVLASNTLGGFVSFHGAGRTLPLTDGRWEIYDWREVAEVFAATRGPGDWRGLMSRHQVAGILLAHTSPEAKALVPQVAGDRNWRLVYLDAAASFWLPAAMGSAATPALAAAPPLMPRFEDAALTAQFAGLAGMRDLEIAALRRALDLAWREVWVRERLGAAQVAAGRYGDAEANYAALLRRAPRNEAALNEMAFLAYRRGDLDAAEGFLARFLEASPENAKALENLAVIRAARAIRPKGE